MWFNACKTENRKCYNMKAAKITVYLVSHNYGKYLEEAIESVLRQTIDDWELIIIDDNSSDNTYEVMNLYRGDERIRLFKTGGIGLPAVCNFALKKASGSYIIRLDGDDIFDENILLVLSNWLDRNPDDILVFPDYFFVDENGIELSYERRQKIYDLNHMNDIPPNGACTMIRTRLIKELGGYREDLGAQDGFDLWNKINGRYKYGNVNIPLFYYRRHKQNLTNNSQHILHARQEIKFDAVSERLDSFRPIIAVIPCRKNYDFRPDVWKIVLQEKSLLERNIEKCIRSKLFDHIVVASDNSKVKDIMSRFNDKRLSFFPRIRQNTIRSKSITLTLEKIVKPLDPNLKGLVFLSYLQAPFVTSNTIEESVTTLIMNNADSAMGMSEVNDAVFKRSIHGLVPINPQSDFRSDFDVIYREANVALATKTNNFKNGSLTGPTVVHFLVQHNECFFIDNEQKLRIAEILLENG